LIEIADDIKKSGFKPDIIVGVARGGWPPARILSDFLNNPNVANIKVEFYVDVYKTVEAPLITQPISVPVNGKRILVVDDVADSGKSLKMVRETLLENGAIDVKIATIYYKPWSIVKPDFYAKSTKAWVIFPWERYETIKKLGEKLKGEGKTLGEIEAELIKIGLQPIIVKRFVKEIFGEK
jgi:hypoxanthine phosphoribosyltransferase